ncbi:MAG: serine/threonine-protein kinase [Elusimicrobiota bacterium]
MKKNSYLFEAAIGLLLTLLVSGGYYLHLPFFENIEFKTYDLRAKLRQNLNPPSEIVLVAIDDDSVAQVGLWPWPRTRLAEVLDKLTAAGPKVIGLNIPLSEAEQNQGLIEIRRLSQKYTELLDRMKVVERGVAFGVEFSSSAAVLDSDSKLLAALRGAGNVVLPVLFVPGTAGGRIETVPAAVSSSAVKAAPLSQSIQEESRISHPILPFTEAASGLGHMNHYVESDGVLRREAPLVQYGQELYPSFAIRLALAYLGLKPEDASFESGRSLTLGRLRVPLDADNKMAMIFNGPPETIRVVSYASVVGDKVDASLFKDKIVIIGPTARGITTLHETPVAPALPSSEVVANVIENILNQKYLVRPPWAQRAELGLLGCVGVFIMLILPRLKVLWGLVVSILIAAILFGAGTYLFINGQWLQVSYPAALLVVGNLIIVSRSVLVPEKSKALIEAAAIEMNTMLGMSFQEQGILDLAFEKFRLCPLTGNLKEVLYNLALEFERKRQLSKAAAVLDHIAGKDPKYKDVVAKSKMLKAAPEGVEGAAKSALGRYQIEKELDRGAIGAVYLARDPKGNRPVVIKTMVLEEGAGGEKISEIKERFFREAEAAGALNHPNIARIFEAGDDKGVVYIAMEVPSGRDLVACGQKGHLLPLNEALGCAADVAEALDYAHARGVVHRDLKPANIVLLEDGSVRIADFCIGGLASSSKAAGVVPGALFYKSPEQVAGKTVDGRSDLFSLAVVLFELVTGEKPFKGGEDIGTLVFQIANDPHPDPLSIRKDLPLELKRVIDKGLAKDADGRFQTGAQFAAALRAVPKEPVACELAAVVVPLDVPAPAEPEAAKNVISVGSDIVIAGINDAPAASPASTSAASVPATSRPHPADPV